jgi:murein DD-endopeptidase MepM/ murein hydrolase activator NlpD
MAKDGHMILKTLKKINFAAGLRKIKAGITDGTKREAEDHPLFAALRAQEAAGAETPAEAKASAGAETLAEAKASASAESSTGFILIPTPAEAQTGFILIPAAGEAPAPAEAPAACKASAGAGDPAEPKAAEAAESPAAAESLAGAGHETASVALDQAIDRVFAFFGGVCSRAGRLLRLARVRGRRRLRLARARAAGIFGPPARRLLSLLRAFASKPGALARAFVKKASGWLSARAEAALDRFQKAVEAKNPAALRLLAALRGLWLFERRIRKRFRRIRRGLRAAGLALKHSAGAAGSAAISRLAACARACAEGIKNAGRAVRGAWRALCALTDAHKKAVLAASGFCLAAAVLALTLVNQHSVYEYKYNGKLLGLVKDKQVVYSTIGLVGDRLSEAYDAEIHIDVEKDISFDRVFLPDAPIDSQEDVLHRLTYMKDMKVKGYSLVADGARLATLDSARSAEALLKRVQGEFLESEAGGSPREYTKVGFAENVEIKEVETKLALLENPEEVFDYIMTGAVEQRIHLVEKGETLSGIAKEYGLPTDELMALNADVVPERMQIGQEIKLERIVPLLTVETTELASYVEAMPFEIAYENTSAMYQGEQIIKLAGVNGEREVKAEITKQNGVEVAKTELSSTTLTEPSTQVMLVGTKEVPPLIGLGYFEYPTRGRLSSRFGTRWGAMHNGIDLAASTGTPIRAADGGNVTFSGWNGSLGYMVKINHGGNRETVYGHCSKLLVSVGDKVYQGQHIANVGSTGRSTGPHLHFEVHINGTPKNPLNYL